MPQGTTRHFGVLIPSTNTTVETEYTRMLPAEWQAHYARVKSASIDGSPFSPPRDEDVEYQAALLGTARVEIVCLIQTSASLFSDDYDEGAVRRMAGAGVPAFTSAMAIGEAMQSLGTKRIAIEGFAATDSYAIGNLSPTMARDAFARIDRPEIEAFVVPGGNFPTLASIAGWEAEFGKPVVTTNQAALWAIVKRLGSADRFPGLGR